MAKFKLDKEHIQGFFFHHSEKLVLGIVLVLLFLFIWMGSGIAGLDSSKSPANLSQQVKRASENIERTEGDVLAKKEEYAPVENHPIRVAAANNPTLADPYKFDTPITNGGPQPIIRRMDPEIFAPLRPEASLATGALVLKKGKASPWDKLENMVQKTIEAPKKKKRRPKKSKRGSGSMEEMMMAGMGAMGGSGAEEEEDDGMSAMEEMMMRGMSSGMMAEGGGAASSGPTVRADATKLIGFRPKTSTGVVGRAVHLVSVRVLVPYQQQWDEFQRVFANAEGYSPQRDSPNYMQFRAQRAELPADPNAQPKWATVSWTEQEQKRAQGFVGFPGELADPRYLHPKLSMPVPPLMLRDLDPLARHSEVPMREVVKQQAAMVTTETETIDPTAMPTAESGAPTPGAPGSDPSAGMAGAPGMMMEGSGSEYAAGMRGMGSGMESMGSGMGAGMSGMMGGMAMAAPASPQAEFYMVRFFDYIQPGKKYIYRVQVLVEDPNRPRLAQAAPHDSILDQTVRDRLVKVAAEERAKNTRLFYFTSDWSEPTKPISAQISTNTYAGGVSLPARMVEIVDPTSIDPATKQRKPAKTGYTVPADGEPTAKVMTVSWSPTYAIDLPGIVDSSRGSLLNKEIPADVIEPISLVYKTIPNYRLASNELVLDLRGGEVLPGQTVVEGEDPLRAPGEVAMLDASGNLTVRNELDDWEAFDQLAPPPPVVVEAAGSSAVMEGFMPSMDEDMEDEE